MTTDLTGVSMQGLRNWKRQCEDTIANLEAKLGRDIVSAAQIKDWEERKQEAQSDLDQVNALLAQ